MPSDSHFFSPAAFPAFTRFTGEGRIGVQADSPVRRRALKTTISKRPDLWSQCVRRVTGMIVAF